MSYKHLIAVIAIIIVPFVSNAQVRIGNNIGSPDPKAILELSDTARGFLLPRLSKTQMNAIDTPTNGLLVFNTTDNSIYQFKANNSLWMPIKSDSTDWFLDTASKKLYLKYGLQNDDSIYYHTVKKKFLFTDTRAYTLSSGSVFNLDEGNSDKYIFKVTASKFPRDAVNLNSTNLYSIFEVDNDTVALSHPFTSTYSGLTANVVTTPGATQKISSITGIGSVTTFAGKDTIEAVIGFDNRTSLRGTGYTEVLFGINNNTNILDNDTANVGTVYGLWNSMNYGSTTGKAKVEGNLYGYYSNIRANFNNKVGGRAYGIFLQSISAANPGLNYGVYTNKGYNRFGDSTLITDGVSAIKPRSVLDINSSTAMIIPVGTTVQRPTSTYLGMLRYNTDNSFPEAWTPSGWTSLKAPILSATMSFDFPAIPPGSTVSNIYSIPNAVLGNVVHVSPAGAMLPGVIIAYSRVVNNGQVEIALANITAAPIDPALDNYYIKVIQ